MSDAIKHECGVAMLRLRKPLDYYVKKYGTALYGLNKMYLLMEKQHNRGQDGAGLATIKMDATPGKRYISRHRSNTNKPIADLFAYINKRFVDLQENDREKLKGRSLATRKYGVYRRVDVRSLALWNLWGK